MTTLATFFIILNSGDTFRRRRSSNYARCLTNNNRPRSCCTCKYCSPLAKRWSAENGDKHFHACEISLISRHLYFPYSIGLVSRATQILDTVAPCLPCNYVHCRETWSPYTPRRKYILAFLRRRIAFTNLKGKFYPSKSVCPKLKRKKRRKIRWKFHEQ